MTYEDNSWANRIRWLAGQRKAVKSSRGDGFCFLYSLQCSLEANLGIILSVHDLCNILMDHILTNASRYSVFHSSPISLIKAAIQFFEDKDFDKDIVDIIVESSASALSVNLHIYQEFHGCIDVLKISPRQQSSKVLPLLFTRSPLHMMRNHYDAVVPLTWVSSKSHVGFKQKVQKSLNVWLVDQDIQTNTQPPVEKTVPAPLTSNDMWSTLGKKIKEEDEDLFTLSSDGTDSDDDVAIDEEMSTFPTPDVTILDDETARPDDCEKTARMEMCEDPERSQRFFGKETIMQLQTGEEGQEIPLKMQDLYHLLLAGEPSELSDLNIQPVGVTSVPGDIDGNKVYVIPNCKSSWRLDTADRRFFKMNSSSRLRLIGVRKIGLCQGNWFCANPECPFLLDSDLHLPNKSYWKIGHQLKSCKSCGCLAKREKCGAKKVVEYHSETNVAVVWHYGVHSCTPKPDVPSLKRKIVQRLKDIPSATGISPHQFGLDQVEEAIRNKDFTALEQNLELFANPEIVRRTMAQEKHLVNVDKSSFDAVACLKASMDRVDKYLIYRISNKEMVNGTFDFVFKSSLSAAKVAIAMDRSQQMSSVQADTAYFDAVHNKVDGFKTIALWCYHPGLQRMYRLAVMDARGETAEEMVIFWNNFNDMLREVTGNPHYLFNPR